MEGELHQSRPGDYLIQGRTVTMPCIVRDACSATATWLVSRWDPRILGGAALTVIVVFLVSDFISDPDNYHQTLAITNRRHDLIAMDLSDPLELEIPNVGLLALEDAETGEITWIDTSQSSWRNEFRDRSAQRNILKEQLFLNAQVDRVSITTAEDYANALASFFKARARRLRR